MVEQEVAPVLDAESGLQADVGGVEVLEVAESEIKDSERKIASAERELENVEKVVEKVLEEEEASHFEVIVLYNGVPKKFEVHRHELVQKLLDQARQAFGPINQPHLLGLFTKAGVELQDAQTIAQAGLHPHQELLLRPSTVRGG